MLVVERESVLVEKVSWLKSGSTSDRMTVLLEAKY